ncbi:MAG: endonuclease III domain-containing protein [Desulfitobacteriaceae bacterium]|nr:endonuclease III domain-containing protein [Desulfitobacteriaceae bacterium]MDD4345459.1 endonuclease III domain-containing protein [Desulfitobacteriaceae bacterium]MDD4400694.1 endonuclease III domain-containing protein [Desulfitobacteriaceae bacterium]
MEQLNQIYKTLLETYGPRNWWPAKTPFEMIVGAILTQNTAWTNVEKSIVNFGENLSPEFIASVPNGELALIIRSSGYHNQKAIKLKEVTKWFERYAYDIEKARKVNGALLRSELLSIKGVGRETADSILTYALNKPFFVVDSYTKRLLVRLGFEIPQTYDDLRLCIERNIPRNLAVYNEFHALIVEHSKCFCKKIPLCEECPLESGCQKLISDILSSRSKKTSFIKRS